MGAPIDKLVIATNSNDILANFQRTGAYTPGMARMTRSPAMDIQVASNFERFVYALCSADASRVSELFADLEEHKGFTVSGEEAARARAEFEAHSCSDGDILSGIQYAHAHFEKVIDPHTATALVSGLRHLCGESGSAGVLPSPAAVRGAVARQGPLVVVATADPAKFPDTVRCALGDGVCDAMPVPEALLGLDSKKASKHTISSSAAAAEALLRKLHHKHPPAATLQPAD
eukprot:GHVU01162921.1.p1 GENE.GHVU01162921.1~~GHVU01162921.1.p1  ORF type:complete len:260 (-),score=43.62 GHVU01162921.1:112-804(-)